MIQMGPCNDCSALDGMTAKQEPHAYLQMGVSVETITGTREEFMCKTCGRKWTRFKALQTSPAPSDVWRWG